MCIYFLCIYFLVLCIYHFYKNVNKIYIGWFQILIVLLDAGDWNYKNFNSHSGTQDIFFVMKEFIRGGEIYLITYIGMWGVL